jgi:hypothetical protein
MMEPSLAQRVRLRVYEHFLETATPPVVEQLMLELGLAREDVSGALRELDASRMLSLVRGTDRILMAWPFSAIATPFRVHARGHDYFANCSWDAIAFHAMLGADDVVVDSYCHHCAQPIRVEMSGERATLVQPATTIVYLALKPAEWWTDIIKTCSNTMVFFCSPDHRDASTLCAPADAAVSLTPDRTHALSVPLYARRLFVDYARPSRDELNAHFAALGFSGPYWQV